MTEEGGNTVRCIVCSVAILVVLFGVLFWDKDRSNPPDNTYKWTVTTCDGAKWGTNDLLLPTGTARFTSDGETVVVFSGGYAIQNR